MANKVIGYFGSNREVEQAADELNRNGFKEISVLGNDSANNEGGRGSGNMTFTDQDLTKGTVTGGAIGGVAGLTLGTGVLGALGTAALLIPGVGPIVAIGPIAAALGGAVTGGITGALVDYGIPKDRSDFYESKIKEGNAVMVIKTDGDRAENAATIMRNYGARDVRVH